MTVAAPWVVPAKRTDFFAFISLCCNDLVKCFCACPTFTPSKTGPMPNSRPRLLLIDQEQFSADILLSELEKKGFPHVRRLAGSEGLVEELTTYPVDVIIFNYHYQHPAGLELCGAAKRLMPEVPIVAVVSPGPAMKRVREWAKETKNIEVVVEKPLSDERFFLLVSDLAVTRQAARAQQVRFERLVKIVPEDALKALERSHDKQTEMFEAVVLFTDVRRSTALITKNTPEAYFNLLNHTLGAQSRLIETFEGSVIKYTGDGLLAVFRGMGRSYLALRCALELTRATNQAVLPFGIGVAQGLVLAGFIGNPHRDDGRRQHYDVIGATVHLSARLCSLAEAGEVMTTPPIVSGARVSGLRPTRSSSVALRGFAAEIACVGLRISEETPAVIAPATDPSPVTAS